MITPTQSIVAEIPQVLQDALQDYLTQHPDWDRDRVLTAALALFLLQNGEGDRRASQVYLEALFRPSPSDSSDSPDLSDSSNLSDHLSDPEEKSSAIAPNPSVQSPKTTQAAQATKVTTPVEPTPAV